ncbi:MAG TPA: LysE family translocator [Microlunatus sp.]
MDAHLLLTWAIVALVGVITPGIDVMMVLRSTIFHGRRSGFAAAIGIEAGYAIWATASLAGLTILLAASNIAYTVVRIAGACYLIWLGCSAIWKSLPRNRADAPEPQAQPPEPTALATARRALLSNLLNPKVGIFYISILPQFLPASGTATAASSWGLALVAIHLTLGIGWLSILVMVGTRARSLFTRTRVKAWLDRTTAAVMIALGIRLATEHR